MKLEILIPTLNRSEFLASNLVQLSVQIEKFRLERCVSILVADNASSDATRQVLATFQQTHPQTAFRCYSHSTNVGLEANALSLLREATGEYVMWLGDDDYLPDGYLQYCLEQLDSRPLLGCIVPGLGNLYKDGSFVPGRLESFEVRYYNPGYETMRQIAHLGHQMSGLVLRRQGLLQHYLASPQLRNIYLFVFFVLQRCLDSQTCYCPFEKVRVNVDNSKDWSYDELGLLDEVYKSYRAFIPRIGESRVEDLILEFTRQHSWRLGLNPKAPVASLFRCLRYIARLPLRLRGKALLARLCLKEALLSAGLVRSRG